ncbi:sulfatase-like hydrolase/transferase [Haloarcula sp. GH36]|uniref:sulfatase-like hydrolase/transferase n=1 Tax=Haloarcula montana TaxID=3111776 RepID=UPI002D785327|nr:sulfatase-like hydrolase/transferase [Haloarcula sp. GH36]
MSDTARNVVLVSIDSLRADHCGFLGDDRGLTPTMDHLASTGTSFEAAVAPGPQTFSSMPAAFTGHHRELGSLDEYFGDTHWERRLTAIDDHLGRYTSVAEQFQELGYSTAGFSPNPWTSTASGFDRGFDHFADLAGESDDSWIRRLAGGVPGVDDSNKAVELTLNLLTGSSFFTPWESYYGQIEAVREQLSEPYFLWVFLLDTHYPFLPARKHRHEQSFYGMISSALRSEKVMRGRAQTMSDRTCESMQRSYRDSVRSVDSFLDRLRTDLADDDPAMIVHSDHGESFSDHGNYGHHHRQLYEENVHVPYIVNDGRCEATITDPTSLATIPEVALSIARYGRFEPGELTDAPAIATSECGTNRAIRDRQFKYLEHDGEPSLFELPLDPEEERDVSSEYPERCAESRSRLDRVQRHRLEMAAVSKAARVVAGSDRRL